MSGQEAIEAQGNGVCIRYATTTESLRSMASSATALVRSTVKSTEFRCRRAGLNGASRSTFPSRQNDQFFPNDLFFLELTSSIIPALLR